MMTSKSLTHFALNNRSSRNVVVTNMVANPTLDENSSDNPPIMRKNGCYCVGDNLSIYCRNHIHIGKGAAAKNTSVMVRVLDKTEGTQRMIITSTEKKLRKGSKDAT